MIKCLNRFNPEWQNRAGKGKMSDIKQNLMRTCAIALCGAFVSMAYMPEVNAQSSSDRLRQGIPDGRGDRVSLTPADVQSGSEDETVVLDNLAGVVVANSPDDIKASGASAGGVEVIGDVVPAGVVAAAQAYVGQAASLASLDRMTRDMVLAYREAGFPVVNVVVPPQDVTNGVVQIIAVVGRLGQLTVEGNPSDEDYYTAAFGLEPGDVIDEGVVVNHLRWKSRRQNRRVNAIYSAGSSFSETDIALEVTETKPWAVFFGADSTGPGSSGEYRFYTGLVLNDILMTEDELSYQFTTTEDGLPVLAAHVINYTFPVAMRTDLQLTGAFFDSASTTGVTGVSKGETTQLAATFISQLDRMAGYYWDARYGYEYKDSDNNFESGVSSTVTPTEVGQYFLLLNGDRSDFKSRTEVFAGVWHSPGGQFTNNTNAAFNLSRERATADYTYYRAGVDHTVFLDQDWLFNVEAELQHTSDRLIASEQISLGGMNTIRGFQESVIQGDTGYLVRLELYTPASPVFEGLEHEGSVRGFGFYDFGGIEVNGAPSASEGTGSANIAGAGVGLSFQNSSGVSAEVAYGWKVEDDVLNTKDLDDGEFHFRIISRH